MPRELLDCAYYVVDGKLVHGVRGLVDGEEISAAEAQAIASAMRAAQPQAPEAGPAAPASFGPEVIDLLERLSDRHRREVAELRELVKAQAEAASALESRVDAMKRALET